MPIPGQAWVSEELYGGNLLLHADSLRMVHTPLYLERDASLPLDFPKDRICKAMKVPMPGLAKVNFEISRKRRKTMPLGFESISHGQIAFGFFNIETDLLLLNDYFIFAPEFCEYVSASAEIHRDGDYEAQWHVYRIPMRNIGKLMGAIYGIDHQGFIGAVYERFPFPEDQSQFKQNPEGFKTRAVIEEMIQNYAERAVISFRIDQKKHQVYIGDYVFAWKVFQELIQYVWLGGMPRWKNWVRPECVMAMKTKIEQSESELFKGFEMGEGVKSALGS